MLTLGAAVLAGGKSSRMDGVNKATLSLHGQSFLDRLLGELGGFGELLVSADRADRYPGCPVPIIPDRVPDTGPLGGLFSLLSACRSDALVVTTCDTPLFSAALAEHLGSYLTTDCDALVLRDRTGRVHPLCGIYRKTALPALEEQLAAGNYRMTALLERLRGKEISLDHTVFPDGCVANINRPQEYEALLRSQRGPAVVAVSGIKNSGKTTLVTRLIPLLREKGYRVAVVKHDGHDFVPDVPDTDSFRCREAGAEGVAVFSQNRYLITHEIEPTPERLFAAFREVDIILAEGFKGSPLKKVEIVRGAVSDHPVCDPGTLLALVTDTAARVPGVPAFGLDQVEAVAQIIEDYVKENTSYAGPLRQDN